MADVADLVLNRLAQRIWQINKIPRDQLEEKLGLEIPPIPDLSIGGIYPTSVLLHWLGSRDHQASVTNVIEVNGIKGTSLHSIKDAEESMN